MKYLLIAGLIAFGSLAAAPSMAQSYNHAVAQHAARHAPVHHRRPSPRHQHRHHGVRHPLHH